MATSFPIWFFSLSVSWRYRKKFLGVVGGSHSTWNPTTTAWKHEDTQAAWDLINYLSLAYIPDRMKKRMRMRVNLNISERQRPEDDGGFSGKGRYTTRQYAESLLRTSDCVNWIDQTKRSTYTIRTFWSMRRHISLTMGCQLVTVSNGINWY